MRRVIRWVAVTLGIFVSIVAVVAVVLYIRGGSRLFRTYDIPVASLDIPTDDQAIARGRHLAQAVTLCAACHGDDLSGKVLFDEPRIATVYASNLTSGRGGVGNTYRDADYVRAIRHGVNPDGRGLMIMHSDAYHRLSQEDLVAIIAYIKSVPPVDREVPATSPAALGRILVALGLFDSEQVPLIPAELIDHEAPFAVAPPEGANAEYGRYLVSIGLCTMCHGSNLRGGPPIEEGAPPGPNIAAYGAPGVLEERFVSTMRTGVTPYGRVLDAEAMPWKVYANMTDEELGAVWRYLMSVQ